MAAMELPRMMMLWLCSSARWGSTGSTMPQEALARRYYRERGLETVIRRPGDLRAVVQRWLSEPHLLQEQRRRLGEQRLAANPAAVLERLHHG